MASMQVANSPDVKEARVQKWQFTIEGDTAIHTPTGAKFFAFPGSPEMANWDMGLALPGRLEDEYDERELLLVAAEVLEERFIVHPLPVPRWVLIAQDMRAAIPLRPSRASYFTCGSIIAALIGLGIVLRGFSF
jgi:hypothetical protein